jgi:site-specific DNA recombinase
LRIFGNNSLEREIVKGVSKVVEKFLAGYIRVSTEMQVERDSLTNQEEVISNYARSKGKEFKIYKDAGISAKDQQRPSFQKMLADIRQGLIDTVVVTKLDRITRSLKDLIELKDLFEKFEISFVSMSQNLDTSNPMGKFSFHILGSVAELEREMTAERVAEDMKGRAKRRKWNGGVPAYGFTCQTRYYRDWLKKKAKEMLKNFNGRSLIETIHSLEQDPKIKEGALAFARERMPEPKVLAIDPREAKIVKVIYQRYLEKKSFRNVVHSLNSRRISTREGQPWASTSIRRILQNPIYYGGLSYNKRKAVGKTSRPRPKEEHILVEGVFDPIISKEQFLEVQKIIADQTKIPSSSKGSRYLLTGLLECRLCGTKMYGYTHDPRKEGKVYQYYRCNGHISKGSAVCPGNTVDRKVVEGLIVDELKKLSTDPERLQEKAEDFNIRFDQEVRPLLEQQKTVQHSLAKIGKKLRRLLGLYEDEVIEREDLVEEKASMDSEKKFLEQELEQINQKISSNDLAKFDLKGTLSSIHDLAEVFDELDHEEKKELLRAIIHKIRVGKHHLDCEFFALPNSFVDCSRMVRDSWPR